MSRISARKLSSDRSGASAFALKNLVSSWVDAIEPIAV
jgi:hypothetical protein